MTTIKVWDGFIRCFHWLLVISIAVLYFSVEEGMIELHFVAGFFTLALIVTRIVWGIVGSRTAKLSGLIHSPKALFQSLKKPVDTIGHSAPGSYMVLAFFALISTQLITGLMSSDGILTDGPLVEYVSSDAVDFANWLHHLNFDILLYAIGLHIAAIVVYRIKGKSLVKAMITGEKALKSTYVERPVTKSPWFAWVIFVGILLLLAFTWGQEPLQYLFG